MPSANYTVDASGNGAVGITGGVVALMLEANPDPRWRDVQSGDGDDMLPGNNSAMLLTAGRGDDTIAGGFGVDDLHGQIGDDVITGSAFSDPVFGGAGFDFINGGFGSGRVNGGADAVNEAFVIFRSTGRILRALFGGAGTRQDHPATGKAGVRSAGLGSDRAAFASGARKTATSCRAQGSRPAQPAAPC